MFEDPNLLNQLLEILTDGMSKGAADTVAIGASAAAIAAWSHLKRTLAGRTKSAEERALLDSPQGTPLELSRLRSLLERLSSDEARVVMNVRGDYVAGNKVVYNLGHKTGG